MAFDGITVSCVAHELNEKLAGGRISKIARDRRTAPDHQNPGRKFPSPAQRIREPSSYISDRIQ